MAERSNGFNHDIHPSKYTHNNLVTLHDEFCQIPTDGRRPFTFLTCERQADCLTCNVLIVLLGREDGQERKGKGNVSLERCAAQHGLAERRGKARQVFGATAIER
ncbi:hypothetical protein KM043_000460 [Ampulex compressa]|nr:hypothetical protein KM043_000460 [Ampulex compressa]